MLWFCFDCLSIALWIPISSLRLRFSVVSDGLLILILYLISVFWFLIVLFFVVHLWGCFYFFVIISAANFWWRIRAEVCLITVCWLLHSSSWFFLCEFIVSPHNRLGFLMICVLISDRNYFLAYLRAHGKAVFCCCCCYNDCRKFLVEYIMAEICLIFFVVFLVWRYSFLLGIDWNLILGVC